MGRARITPLGSIRSIPASGEVSIGSISFVNVRTLTITCRATYHASATSGVRCRLFYSPDGMNWDTVPYTYFDVNLTAGSTIQETHIVDSPERGFIEVKVQNLDGSYSVGPVFVWKTLKKW